MSGGAGDIGKAWGMANSQPVQHEFQRYPGHPATTCLSPVFRSVLPVPGPYYPANPKATDAAQLNPYYDIAPRVGRSAPDGGGGGGSNGGTMAVNPNSAVLSADTDRLYASVDELMFSPVFNGKARFPNTSVGPAPKAISKAFVEKTKFFITANSTAPETTLYNTPRIAVWPVSVSTSQRTAYDSLLAFCSTIGGKEYFFTRNPISGARSSTLDYSSRNKELYEYLQALTKTSIPGYGGNFLRARPESP